jgi:membrane-bound lytic murein transglycosylase B
MPAAKTLKRWQKATALLPLALLSGAWTMSLTLPTSATAQGGGDQPARLADGTKIPDAAIEAPASVSSPGEIAPGVPTGSADKVIAGASANGIPAAALSAYQRAAQVIDAADKTCHLDWTLIAAIGRVESNHGRYGGNALDGNGISRPGIYGIPLDGTNGTQKIRDTDAGQYDDDPTFDRAVGPMQFIPSTWSVIGVDGDGDGRRNPQDIDDASLATAVYLCSGKDDLSSRAGERSAVYRYNHSNAYVDLVLSIARAYADGDFASVPTSAAGTTTMTPDYGDSVFASGTSGFRYAKGHGYRTFAAPRGGSGSGRGTTTSGGSTPSAAGTTSSAPTSSAPVLGGSTGSGGSGGGSATSGGAGSAGGSVGSTVDKVTKPVKDATKPLPKPTPPPVVDKTLTKAQATAQCLATLPKLPPPTPAELNACVTKLLS